MKKSIRLEKNTVTNYKMVVVTQHDIRMYPPDIHKDIYILNTRHAGHRIKYLPEISTVLSDKSFGLSHRKGSTQKGTPE